MAIVVTENWSGRRLSERPPWTASREFVVTGTTSIVDACAATGVPQNQDAHDTVPALQCEGPVVKESKGIDSWVITCDSSYNPPEAVGDPLLAPTTITWAECDASEPVDYDLDGLPIVSSNTEPAKGSSRPFGYDRVTLV